ncbi:protein MSF1 [Uncinocarpus reesii 1704]|uniref:Protein MSF1 n=1 Tax=Uncinocarpus reesii (strain UAMH 1704) TaxID=336963 RepID=C4JT73_UNCRE|nr:protein MSF1 [Uncinocarpus reesii 1704]EEP80820.1 protein MSF1 [Uncinocarpus reesii 1704]
MKVFASECIFDYSWEEVSTANWRKYCPWNSKSTHVVAVDVLSQTLNPNGISAPQWILNLFGGSSTSHVYEVSYVDPASKRVTMCSTNLTWSNVLSVRETVIYQPSQSKPASRTEFRQDAQITALCGGWQKVKNKIEELSVETFSQNATKGREGFEAVLEMSRRVFREQKEMEALQKAHQ